MSEQSVDSPDSASSSILETLSPDNHLPPPSPSPSHSHLGKSLSASFFLRTGDTLEGLVKQSLSLEDSDHEDADESVTCCCGKEHGCRSERQREKLARKLALSGEIGNTLLQQYEALEKKHVLEIQKCQRQVDEKRIALAEAIRRANALEQANALHMTKYAELNRKKETLEKHLTQSVHTQALTQQSLTHVRAELTTLRGTMQRQSIALASGAGVEERLSNMSQRLEEARDAQHAADRKEREESKKVKRAEMRIADLEGLLQATQRELDEIKEARAKDAQALLDNAKSRLTELHQQLSETFQQGTDGSGSSPEIQKAMEDLVASNAMLKHDASELSHLLAESRDEIRGMKEEVEEMRIRVGVMSAATGRFSPLSLPPHLTSEIKLPATNAPYSHVRTESSPTMDNREWRMSAGSSIRWDTNRRSSFAPSFTSTSTADGITSPGLGVGAVGEYGGGVSRTLSPPPAGGDSPKLGQMRASTSGGIGYILNGVPKPGSSKPQFRRKVSDRSRRSYASTGVDPISETGPLESDMGGHTTDEPLSPASDTFRIVDASRQRRSLMLARRSTYNSISPHESFDYNADASQTLVEPPLADLMASRSDGELGNAALLSHKSPAKKANRKTLLLLTKNKGVQTEPEMETDIIRHVSPRPDTITAAPDTSSIPEERSETSSLHQVNLPSGPGSLTALIDHLSKLLARLHAADILTLNKRLRRQHLPGDVAHLSRSTLRALQTEVGDIRHHFRSIADASTVQKKEWNLLLRLLKEMFVDLVDLQGMVNDVTLEPKLAKRLQREAYRDEEAEEASTGGGGLGWIANPITRLFVTPAAEVEDSSKTSARLDRGKLQPTPLVKAAPKQAAVSGATTTHVSVEFGGTGIIRRATPAGSTQTTSGPNNSSTALPPTPDPAAIPTNRERELSAGSTATSHLSSSPAKAGGPSALRPPGTLRPSRSRANRNELLGIFAGAQKPISSVGAQNWSMVDNDLPRPGTMRNVSSPVYPTSYGGDQTIRARDLPSRRKRLSAVVDAVIDRKSDEHTEDDQQEAPFQPLLERTLRPRGLSDSSIRSTFVSHAANNDLATSLSTGINAGTTARQGGYSGYGGGLLAGLGRRLYWSKTEVSPINPPPDASEESVVEALDAGGSPKKAEPITTSPRRSTSDRSLKPAGKPIRAIPITPSKTSNSAALGSSNPAGTSVTGGGFLSLLASSLAGADTLVHDSDDEGRSPGRHDRSEREEMMGASLRQGVMVARTASRAGQGMGKRWE